VSSLLVLDEVIPSVEPFLVALAIHNWAFVRLRPMDFAFVALEAAFVTEIFPIARCMVAGVGTNVFVLMSPSTCKYECLIFRRATCFNADFVENNCCSGHPRTWHLRDVSSSEGVGSAVRALFWHSSITSLMSEGIQG